MAHHIHIHNASNSSITVQCFKKKSSKKKGVLVKIKPNKAAMVYKSASTGADVDIEISQINTIHTIDNKEKEIIVKKVKFRTDNDHSWIAKEGFIVRQKYGAALNVEDSSVKYKPWTITANKITLKDIEFLNLPDEPDTWEISSIFTTQYNNNSDAISTIGQTVTLSYSESKTWSHSGGLTINATAEIKSKIPFLFEGKMQLSAEVFYELNWQSTKTKSHEWSPTISLQLNPHTTNSVKSIIMMGELTVLYNATLILEYENSNDLVETSIKGEYKGDCAVKAILSTEKEKPLGLSDNTPTLKLNLDSIKNENITGDVIHLNNNQQTEVFILNGTSIINPDKQNILA